MLGITITTDWVAAMKRASDEIMLIRDQLESGVVKIHEKFTMINARVYRTTKGRMRLYVPEELRQEIVSEAHKNLCHMGIDKTLLALKETYYFPKMREFVTKYVNRCINCLFYKNQVGKKSGFLHPLDKGSEPFVVMHVDHLGLFVKTRRDNNHVIAMICGFSKYSVLKAVNTTNAEEVLLFVRDFIANYGKPKIIVSDRGTAFTSKVFEDFCRDANIQHVRIATSTPRANGQVERLNRLLLTCMATTSNEEGSDWDDKLFEVQWAVNNCEHRVTKRTPYELIFKKKGVGMNTNPLTRELIELNESLNLEDERESVSELLNRNESKLKAQFDKRRKKPEILKKEKLF